jgi:hypothetical protein
VFETAEAQMNVAQDLANERNRLELELNSASDAAEKERILKELQEIDSRMADTMAKHIDE